MNQRRSHVPAGALALLSAILVGCTDGPVPELRSLNPWARKQWEADEREVTTYHRKLADLTALRSRAPRLSPAEGEEVAFQLAERFKEEKSPVLRAELIRTLGVLPTPTARQAVLAATADEAVAVRVAACKAVSRYPDQEGFQALAKTVSSDTDVDVRMAAARELGKYRGFEAPQALRPALDDRDPALQLAAMQSLESLTGHQEYRNSVATWREFLDGGNPTPPAGPSIPELVSRFWYWY